MARSNFDAERHRRASRKTIVLFEIDSLSRNFVHLECPEHACDGEEHLPFGDPHPRANAAATELNKSAVNSRRKISMNADPTPNIQWSLSMGFAKFADSDERVESLMYRSGYS